jgi:tRNA nucleotidyltransferase (CCA-adding enzyme)
MDINEFIENKLRPTKNEEGVLQSTINSITTILQNDSNLSVSKCLRGGSFAKGTMLKGNFEADIVYIINKDYDFEKLLDYVKRLLKSNFQHAEVEIKYKAVNLKIQKPIGIIEFDVLPAFEINSPLQMSKVVNEKYYAGSSNKFQVKYIKEQKKIDGSFGDVIRILKYWKKLYKIPLSGFQLELLSANGINGINIKNWEGCLLACFYTIVNMTNGTIIYPNNCKYFNNNQVSAQKTNLGVLIVDPGNPANNVVANLNKTDINHIKSHAIDAIKMIKDKKMNELLKVK